MAKTSPKSPVVPLFHAAESEAIGIHEYRRLEPSPDSAWLNDLASEYARLRSQSVSDFGKVSAEGIRLFSVERLTSSLRCATIPDRTPGPFDVVRSDFGETIGYVVLEQLYGTKFGYKSLRDRELVQLPGRGIDAVGMEDGEVPVLVLSEAKVSSEDLAPPRVVDVATDSLRAQHLNHMGDLQSTSRKLFDLARRTSDLELCVFLLTAAECLKVGKLDAIRIIACCVLVRPGSKHRPDDYGSFRASPDDYRPAAVRFLAVCIPTDIEVAVQEWHSRARMN